jgi:hypothetical protein
MSTKNKLYSKDGKYYDTLNEKFAADHAWETQREEQRIQNNLIAEQNRLIQEESERKEKLQQEQIEFEREKEWNEMYEQELQREHDKEMRLLKLLDGIGLSKQYYDDFINYLFGSNIDSLLEKIDEFTHEKQLKEKDLNNIDKYLGNPKTGIEDVKKFILNYELESELERNKKIFETYLSNPLDRINTFNFFRLIKDNRSYIAFKKIDTLCNKLAFIYFILGFIFFIPLIIGLIADSSVLLCVVITLGYFFLLIFFYLCLEKKLYKGTKNLVDIAKDEINKIDKKLSNPISSKDAKLKLNDTKKNIKNDIKVIDKNIDDIMQQFGDVSIKWNDFIEFRKKHYNSQFEKVLLDLGLKEKIEKLNLTYPKINNNNKINDGTIEDYIAYFDTLDK